MKNHPSNHAVLSDAELLLEVRTLTIQERGATTRLIAALGELDARRLYLAEGFSSLFAYCTLALHLSEHAAYLRIEAARAARKWPAVLERLADGSVHLTAVALLGRHLTMENHADLLGAARHKSKREIEEIIAALRPQPAVPSTVRKLPAPTMQSAEGTAAGDVAGKLGPGHRDRAALRSHPVEFKPLAPEQYKVQFTISRDTLDKLREAQDLLRHRIPNGDVAAIFDRALTMVLAELRRTKHGAVARPRPAQVDRPCGRDIPAAVKRVVWARDGGRCAFVGATDRCGERGFLEYHHVVPFADGGATVAGNLQLRCRAHNAYEAERWFAAPKEALVRGQRGDP